MINRRSWMRGAAALLGGGLAAVLLPAEKADAAFCIVRCLPAGPTPLCSGCPTNETKFHCFDVCDNSNYFECFPLTPCAKFCLVHGTCPL